MGRITKTLRICLFWMFLVGCTSSQNDILGPAPMTSQEVYDEVINNDDKKASVWLESNTLPARSDVIRYHSGEVAESLGSYRASYVKNERLLLYFYPSRDSLGHIKAGYLHEIPLYKKVHMIFEGESY
ncbi:TPA: hypothetical protein I7682_18020 [Vibrio vulnificus]|nr:hypothetical protein [Vibrio vulnificus]